MLTSILGALFWWPAQNSNRIRILLKSAFFNISHYFYGRFYWPFSRGNFRANYCSVTSGGPILYIFCLHNVIVINKLVRTSVLCDYFPYLQGELSFLHWQQLLSKMLSKGLYWWASHDGKCFLPRFCYQFPRRNLHFSGAVQSCIICRM